MIEETSEFKLEILWQASSLGGEPRPKIVRCGQHRKCGVDQLRIVTEAALGASRLHQSWIDTSAEPRGARALKLPLAANVESANSIRAEVTGSNDLVRANEVRRPRNLAFLARFVEAMTAFLFIV